MTAGYNKEEALVTTFGLQVQQEEILIETMEKVNTKEVETTTVDLADKLDHVREDMT